VRAHTQDLAKDDADHLAAIASGLWSLASGAGRKFAGGEAVRQVTRAATSAPSKSVEAGRRRHW